MNKFFHFFFSFFSFFNLSAQDAILNTYNFGEGIDFVNEDDHAFKLGGYIQPFLESRVVFNDTLDEVYVDNRFRLRRLRLRLSGKNPSFNLNYRIQFDLSGVSETGEETSNPLLDAFITYSFNKRTKLTIGQRALRSDNRELTMSSASLQIVERSRLTSSFASIRDFGLFLQRDFRFKNGSFLRNYLEVTSGDGMNNLQLDHGGFKYGGRIDYLPFGLFTNMGQFRQADIMRERSLKLVVGLNYSYNQGISSRRGRDGGQILYLNENGNESLPDFIKMGADMMLKINGFSLLAEYQKTSSIVPDDITQRVRNNGTVSSSFLVNGEESMKNYINGRMMLGSAYNVQMGYLLKSLYSFDIRYTHLESKEFSFLNNGTFYNRPNYYTFGFSKYFARNYGFKVQASITYVDVNENSTYATQTGDFSDPYLNVPHRGSEFLFRLITSISF
ncbi:MAG: porin [Flavobacteriales bacterium]